MAIGPPLSRTDGPLASKPQPDEYLTPKVGSQSIGLRLRPLHKSAIPELEVRRAPYQAEIAASKPAGRARIIPLKG
jgi:hypothetical protein